MGTRLAATRLAKAVLLLLLAASGPLARPGLGDEIRALWVTRWDYAQPSDVQTIVRNAASYGFNRVFFQVRGNATAFYASTLEPWAWELTGTNPSTLGQDPGWDPLAVAVTEAQAQGIELHAYVNVYPGWSGLIPPPPGVPQLWTDHPDWFVVTKSGQLSELNSSYVWTIPGHPGVDAHLRAVLREIATNYAVDGIHLDYIRFPAINVSWDPWSLSAFLQQTGQTPQTDPAQWSQWRRDQVTNLVQAIDQDLVSIRPGLQLSAAVVSPYTTAFNNNFQDVRAWLQGGFLDVSHPMLYVSSYASFLSLLPQHLDYSYDRHVAPGVGAFVLPTPQDYDLQLFATRLSGAHGSCTFAYSDLFPDHSPGPFAIQLRKGPFVQDDAPVPQRWKTNPSDDDSTGPRIHRIQVTPAQPRSGEPWSLSCTIEDPSGVYDDTSGSEGQGVVLQWDRTATFTAPNEVTLSRAAPGSDIFQTDSPILAWGAGKVYFRITAYDDDADGGDPFDRAFRESAILEQVVMPALASHTAISHR